MIPKKIHYFWFGGPKTRLAERCIASWRRHCPGWEIVEWNESNADIGSSAFASAAFAAKKWGFVPDHLRMTKIRDEGGVYFDTDVELIRPVDDLVEEGPFFACECDSPRRVGPGLGFAAEKGDPVCAAIAERYETLAFDPACHLSQSGPAIATEVLEGFPDRRCLPSAVFNPKGGCAGEVEISSETRAIHHYAASWFSWKQRLAYIWWPKVRKWFRR